MQPTKEKELKITGSDYTTPQEALSGSSGAQNLIVDAFRQKYGHEPEDVGIEIAPMKDKRWLWFVRKLSANERRAREIVNHKRDLAAISASQDRAFVYFVKDYRGWFSRWFRRACMPRVYLTERGARQAAKDGAEVYKAEVLS